jgi:O-antigen/teichoic acid export membrane protein
MPALKQDGLATPGGGDLDRAQPRTGRQAGAEPGILTAAKGGGILFPSRLVSYSLTFVSGIALARLLAAEELGLYRLALTTAMMVSGYAMVGFSVALVRFVSLYANRKDHEGLWGTLQVGLGLPMVLSLLGATGLFALADPIAVRLFREPDLSPLLRVGSILIVFRSLSQLLAAATRGFKAMHYTAIANMLAAPVVRLLVVVGLAITVGLTAAGALGAYGAAVAVSAVMLLYFLDRLFSLRRPLQQGRRNWGEMLRFSLPVYVSGRLTGSVSNLRTLLLGALSTSANVGSFTVANQINTLGSVFHSSLTTSSAPVIAELHDRGALDRMKVVYQTVTKWTLTVNLPFFLLILLFPGELLAIFGTEFAGAALALSILAWANLANTGTGICGVVIDMTGHTKLKLVNSAVALVLSVGLSILLVPRWGVTGTAVTALIVAVVVNLLRLVEVFILFRLWPYNRSYAKPILAGLAAALAGWSLGRLLPIEADLIRLAAGGTGLMAVYAGVILMLGFSPEDRAVLSSLNRRVRGRRRAAIVDADAQDEKP